MAERYLHKAVWLLVTISLAAGFLWGQLAEDSWYVIGLWAAALALADQIRVEAPSNARHAVSLAIAVAAISSISDPWSLAAIFAFGLALSRIIMGWIHGPIPGALSTFVRQAAGLAFLAAIDLSLFALFDALEFKGSAAELGAVAIALVLWLFFDGLIRVYLEHGLGDLSGPFVVRLMWRDWPVVASLFGSGALFGAAYPILGWWSVPLAVVPYVFTHVAFSRYFGARRTYGQMIRAMSRIAEIAGISDEGHADSTASLCLAIGLMAGMHPDQLTELEYAALLHDIGRVSVSDPKLSLASHQSAELATLSAAIIGQASYLNGVAEIVANQYMPYRQPGQGSDPEVGVASRIVRVAAEYDRLIHERELRELDAIEVLHRGSAYDYDPEIVLMLREVVGA